MGNARIRLELEKAVIKMGPERTEEIIGELSSILTRSNLNSIQNEEISNILILLLSSISTIDLALGESFLWGTITVFVKY